MRGLVLFVGLLVACNGEEHEEGPECTAISEACHDAADAGVAGAAECHDLAHEADEDACAAERASCLATCEDAGTDTDDTDAA